MHRLSILMPVYNREKYVSEAINSILSQSFTDFELIILDDGSTDKTRQEIEKISDDRIVYKYQKNAGEYATTNELFKMVNGEYVTWVHSDDTLEKDSLKYRVLALDNNPEIDVVHGDIIKTDQSGQNKELLEATNDSAKEILHHYCTEEKERTKKGYFIHHLTFMFRKAVIKRVGEFDKTLPFGGDLDWMMRALTCCEFKRVPKVLYFYRRHGETVSVIAQDRGVKIHEVTRQIQKRYCPIIREN